MSKIPFTKAKFVGSFPTLELIPKIKNSHGKEIPEIAFVGRSNVGKSTLINHLLQNKTLARVSSTPGKTQLLNFFIIDDLLCLVDLPGYGYARVPKATRESWAVAIDQYLNQRQELSLLLFLIDIRRVGEETDLQFLTWAEKRNLPILIVFTKVDKLTLRERKNLLEEHKSALSELGAAMPNFCLYSSKSLQYRKLLIDKINKILQPSTEH